MKEPRVKSKEKVLDQLCELISARLSADVLPPVVEFIQHYYRVTPVEELQEREMDNLYGASLSCWELLQSWQPGETGIQVFNPDLERNGWQSRHTVIQILQRDMPFIVDSVRMELNRRGLGIHTVHSGIVNVVKTDTGQVQVQPMEGDGDKLALLYIEVDRHSNSDDLKAVASSLLEVLKEVASVVDDFPAMLKQVEAVKAEYSGGRGKQAEELKEIRAFLDWLCDDRFTFLGFEMLNFTSQDGATKVECPLDSLLGIRQLEGGYQLTPSAGELEFIRNPQRFVFAKDHVRSRVHRPAYRDLVVLKRLNKAGEVCGEYRFYGLYTSPVYNEPPQQIPIIRQRFARVKEQSGFRPGGHNAKSLERIMSDLPRDELLLSSADELFVHIMGIFNLQERRKVRLLIRSDTRKHFYTMLYYVPRDIFNTVLRTQVQNLISERIGALDCEFTTYYSESILTRVYFVLQVDPESSTEFDAAELEADVARLSRSWEDELHTALISALGDERGNLLATGYRHAFPSAYREHFTPANAVFDIEHMERLAGGSALQMSFYRQLEKPRSQLRFKLFNADRPLVLSDVIPILENLGMRVLGEHPYRIVHSGGQETWLHDFILVYKDAETVELEAVQKIFQDAFYSIWQEKAENDDFNRLVIGAGLSWREVAMLRAYARYNQQIRFGFSQPYIADTLSRHQYIARLLVALFRARFDPARQGRDKNHALINRICNSIGEALDKVDNLNDDKILRRYQELILATLRVNYYQNCEDGGEPDYFVFKLSPQAIEAIPLPRPMFEIFVYSARMEGVHLRGGRVARGGLRWSDRREDYRTEVLGLVKAQQVKNAVIVPVGAKGGFVGKKMPTEGGREAIMEEGIACYKQFIRGLLDVTDNYCNGEIVPPAQVVCYDDPDPYLVVAADKGTATFSDIANGIAAEFGFWLGDAFASGGSQGYDHKKMGITARGAWESVKLHFRELGLNTQTDDFTVVGIGDMAGDVFGNGMLMSEHIALVAAFNHQHIFIDPTPDVAASFTERQRMFALPRSSWSDYDTSLISAGGGIFSRDAKSIPISRQMGERFGIKASHLAPNDLISALLKSEVDLLWNGGIGTYVKASFESHADAGDKANDGLRVDGRELRCRVLDEGGNLGATQQGRIEFCLNGGACNTDFIDNAGGVDCSDHEVNIKILLNGVIGNGDLTAKQRNELLSSMTDEVSRLVLGNNASQALALSLALEQSRRALSDYRRLIHELESSGRLVRSLEYIPTDEQLQEREHSGQFLTRPELSVLISYTKAELKETLNDDYLVDNVYVAREIDTAFPRELVVRYPDQVSGHQLRREIIATQLANAMINRMGISFPSRMRQASGCSVVEITAAFVAAREIFDMERLWKGIQALDNQVPTEIQESMYTDLQRLVRRAVGWLLVQYRQGLEPKALVERFEPGVRELGGSIGKRLSGEPLDYWQARYAELVGAGVPEALAEEAASFDSLYSVLGMVVTTEQTQVSLEEVAAVYFLLGERLHLYAIDTRIKDLIPDNQWQSMAREGFREELVTQQRAISVNVLSQPMAVSSGNEHLDAQAAVDGWLQQKSVLVERWDRLQRDLVDIEKPDSAVFAVILRELIELASA